MSVMVAGDRERETANRAPQRQGLMRRVVTLLYPYYTGTGMSRGKKKPPTTSRNRGRISYYDEKALCVRHIIPPVKQIN